MNKINKNIILFVGNVPNRYVESIEKLEKELKCDFRIALITNYDEKIKLSPNYKNRLNYVKRCDFRNTKSVDQKLKNIKKEVLMIYFISERFAGFYCDILKMIKLKNNPSIKAVEKSIDKFKMRKVFGKCDLNIIPKFIKVRGENSAGLISKKIGFPCILKPAHLSRSKLITVSNDLEELKENLKKTFSLISKIYNTQKIKFKPLVLAEEMMEGKAYTIDVYVDNRQRIYFTPFIFQITAKDLDIDDFHIYARVNPSNLSQSEIKNAKIVVKKSVIALKAKNLIIHFELMKTKTGWKIIEVGPRIGAYRHEMLNISYNIDHISNYILLRLNRKPKVTNKLIFYSSFLEFFPKEEGYVKSIKGINEIKKLKSFSELTIKNKIGDKAGLSKDGYLHTLRVILKSKNKSNFYRDIEKAKNLIEIETSKIKQKLNN